MKIYDSFLPKCLENQISDIFLDMTFPWKCSLNPTYGNKKIDSSSENENIYEDSTKLSLASSLYDQKTTPFTNHALMLQGAIYCMCDKSGVDIRSILRIRAGMYIPMVGGPEYNDPHTDTDIPHTVILYYVNDSDGDTFFFDKQYNIVDKVKPKKGRIVVFDGNTIHASSQPSKGVRVTLNLNFHGIQI